MIVLDTESHPNYFLICMRDRNTRRTLQAWIHEKSRGGCPVADIRTAMSIATTYGFNSIGYDLPMIAAFLAGWGPQKLNKLSRMLIDSGKPWWKVCKIAKIEVPKGWNHIDLFETAPGVKISLKIYGGRMHSRTMQDLPYHFASPLSASEAEETRVYCENDLALTDDLFDACAGRLALRESLSERYGVDMRSKSDAQAAEAIFKADLAKAGIAPQRPDYPAGTTFKYVLPTWLQFKNANMRKVAKAMRTADFIVGDSGHVILPDTLIEPVSIDRTKYQIGIGGLHSIEKSQMVVPAEDEELFEADFASFYPIIIRNERFYPKHIGSIFLKIYSIMIAARLKAKAEGDFFTNEGLKISLNGSFGKFSSPYSFLYSPDLLINTTLTGQLTLLMLIERVVAAGGKVMSANTDGIVILCKKAFSSAVREAMDSIEVLSGYVLEETHYSGIYSRDVNNYIAVKTDGSVKGKGVFAETGLMKSPAGQICYDAVKQFVADGTPIFQTIYNCDDIRGFVHVKKVTGGAVHEGKYLGKNVRWYYGRKVAGQIAYVKNGNKVPASDGAVPVMTLPDKLPTNIDYDRYIQQAFELLGQIGYERG